MLEEVSSLRSLAPDGVSLPIDTEAKESGYVLSPVPLVKWLAILEGEVER
jgi:hypothetical protein